MFDYNDERYEDYECGVCGLVIDDEWDDDSCKCEAWVDPRYPHVAQPIQSNTHLFEVS